MCVILLCVKLLIVFSKTESSLDYNNLYSAHVLNLLCYVQPAMIPSILLIKCRIVGLKHTCTKIPTTDIRWAALPAPSTIPSNSSSRAQREKPAACFFCPSYKSLQEAVRMIHYQTDSFEHSPCFHPLHPSLQLGHLTLGILKKIPSILTSIHTFYLFSIFLSKC